MAFIEYTNSDAAKAAFVNALQGVGVEPTVSMDANALVFATLANQAAGVPVTQGGPGTVGTGTILKQSIAKSGDLTITSILVDLTGLNSGGAAGDIIGKNGEGAAYITRLSAANGTITGIRMTCLEAPAGGDDDIDLYSATEGTGVEDTAISALTEVQLINSGTLASGTVVAAAAMPAAATDYLYLVGQGTSDATYTAGKLLIELYGI
ncbi:MAG: hypothetical protein ACO3ND_07950 [Opitutales bacterium]